MPFTREEQIQLDLSEALQLLQVSRPQNLLVSDDEYWGRYHKLLDKYFPDEDEEEEDDEF